MGQREARGVANDTVSEQHVEVERAIAPVARAAPAGEALKRLAAQQQLAWVARAVDQRDGVEEPAARASAAQRRRAYEPADAQHSHPRRRVELAHSEREARVAIPEAAAHADGDDHGVARCARMAFAAS